MQDIATGQHFCMTYERSIGTSNTDDMRTTRRQQPPAPANIVLKEYLPSDSEKK